MAVWFYNHLYIFIITSFGSKLYRMAASVVLLIDPSYEMVNRICVTSVWPSLGQLIFGYLWPEFPMTHMDCPVFYKDPLCINYFTNLSYCVSSNIPRSKCEVQPMNYYFLLTPKNLSCYIILITHLVLWFIFVIILLSLINWLMSCQRHVFLL